MKSVCRGPGPLQLLSVLALLAVTATRAWTEMATIEGVARAYLREGPGTEFRSTATLRSGDGVDVLDVEGSWTKIQTLDGKVGYVYREYVVPQSSAAAPSGEPPPRTEAARAATAPSLAAPVPAPTAEPVLPPLGAASAPSAPEPRDDLTIEVGRLRSEIADLKREIQDRVADVEESRAGMTTRGIVSPIPAAADEASGSMTARERSAGALAVGFLALVVGWVLGSAFTRRRSRSQRPRLRF